MFQLMILYDIDILSIKVLYILDIVNQKSQLPYSQGLSLTFIPKVTHVGLLSVYLSIYFLVATRPNELKIKYVAFIRLENFKLAMLSVMPILGQSLFKMSYQSSITLCLACSMWVWALQCMVHLLVILA